MLDRLGSSKYWYFGFFQTNVPVTESEEIGKTEGRVELDDKRIHAFSGSFMHESYLIKDDPFFIETRINPSAGRFLLALTALMFVGAIGVAIANLNNPLFIAFPVIVPLTTLVVTNVLGYLHHQSNLNDH